MYDCTLPLLGCNALVAVAYAIFELAKPKLLTATSVHEFIDVLTHQLKHMTSASPLLRAARRILVSIGPKQLNEARRMVTIDVASDAEDMMKRKLHRKFNYFDDVAFGEAYAHFCTACIQDSNADRFSVLQNNSQQNNYMNKAEGTYIGTIISHSNSNPHSLRPSRRQHDADDMYIDYRALDLPSFRKLMIELASFSILWSKDLVGLDRLFVAFDADHNGFVDVHEFMQGIQAMSQVGTKEEKLRLLFMSHDARGTGLLGAKDISCILKTMYKLLDYPKVGRRARDAAAKAIVNILSTQDHSDNNETCICFDEFLALPDVQPDVLKFMNFHIPFASKRSAKKCAKRATEAAKAVASANAAELTLRQTKRKSPLKRKSSVDVVQQLKTSPRGPG
jgi:Ca2+-binding EF-hand superfamily protein